MKPALAEAVAALGSPRKKTIASGPKALVAQALAPKAPASKASASKASASKASTPGGAVSKPPAAGTPSAGSPVAGASASDVSTLDAPGEAARKTPRPRRAKVKAEPEAIEALQKLIVASLEDDKAENVVTLDLTGKAMFCDRMVIASGLADRQIAAMAQHLREKLHAAGQRRVQIEGLGGSDWVLIDVGDIVVHLFMPDARELYALEKMWGQDLDETASV